MNGFPIIVCSYVSCHSVTVMVQATPGSLEIPSFSEFCIDSLFSSVQLSPSVVSNSLQPHGLQHASLPVHHQLPELTETHIHQVGDAIQPSHALSAPSPLAFNLSQHQGRFKWVSSSHRMAKVLEFQLQHQSFQRIFRLISFRMDGLNLLTVQRPLKNILQHHSSKASILRHSVFFL